MDLRGKIIGALWGEEFHDLEYLTNRLMPIIREHYNEAMRDAETYWTAEIDYHKDKIAELELDALLHDEQAYGQPGKLNGAMLNIKKRGNFR